MSTTIYNGFVFNNASDLDEAFQTLLSIKSDLQKTSNKYILDIAIRKAVFMFDEHRYNGTEHEGRSLIFNQIYAMEDYNRQFGKTRNNPFEQKFGVSIAPYKGKVYGIYFGGTQEVIKQFMEFDHFSEFMYYNNTDEPEDISREDWKDREGIWEAILPGVGIPSHSMLHFDLVHEHIFTVKDIHEDEIEFPSILEREASLIRDLESTFIVPDEFNSLPADASPYVLSKQWQEFRKSESFKKQVDELKKKLNIKEDIQLIDIHNPEQR